MRPFRYFEPNSLEETVELMGRYDGRASVMAGGTDLLVEMKEHLRTPDFVINIKKIPGLDFLHYDAADGLQIGALTTVRSVEVDADVARHYAGLAEAARQLASIQVRNRATVAGNICRASPSADTAPPLIADGASVTCFGPQGERTLLLEDFFTGPGQTVLAPDELLIHIDVPVPAAHTGQVYLKHGRRKAMELATVGVAVTLVVEGDRCRDARIVLGAVAPTPLRASEAEAILMEKNIDEAVIDRAARATQAAARPISDVRSSAAYRKTMTYVLTRRAIQLAFARAQAND
jgi:carbon-monoxide dehydrogenase medium subunit